MLFRCRPVLLLALVLPALAALAQPSDPVERTPPALYQEHLAGLLTPLAEVLPGKTAFPTDTTGGIVLLAEAFRYRDDAGLNYKLYHSIDHAVSQAGVESLSTDTFSFDRERESIFLIEAATILPDGTRQPVEAKGAFIQTPQHEAENALYTSEAQLRVIYPNVAPGAITEVVVLIRENVPVMPGEFAASRTFGAGWPVYLNRFVVDLPADYWRRVSDGGTAPGVPTPTIETPVPGRERRTWVARNTPATHWEYYAPSYEFRAPTLWLTTLRSWDDLARWYQTELAESSHVGPELAAAVDQATAGLTDRAAIIAALHSLAADEVRYTGLEFGLAGYRPHACDDVWKKRYGDCKDKSALLRAMLAQKGIRSHLVLLDTRGNGRNEKASPSWQQFNHAILAVEGATGGGYLFCDPTGKHLPAGTVGLGDLARDVLVLRDDRAEWVRTPDKIDAATRIGGDLTLSPEGELSGWFVYRAEGSDAAFYAAFFNGFDQQELRKKLQEYAGAFFPGAEVLDVDYKPVKGPAASFQCRAYFVRPARAAAGATLAFPYPTGWLPYVDNVGERRFPYFTARRDSSVDFTITLAPGWNVTTLPEPFSAPSDIARFEAAWRREGNRLTATLAYRPERAELSPAEFSVYQRSVRALMAWLERPAVLANDGKAAALPAVASTTDAQSLPDFPILPTGEGQLRLLDERYPEDSGKDAQRRLALGKILQWFPQEPDVVFQARLHLASLDAATTGQRVFADTVAGILRQHGATLSLSLRAWGEYREANARWEATKDPASLAKLQELARDERLSPFRRGWSARSAGLALLETKPLEAAAYLAPFGDLKADAQAQIVSDILRAYSRSGDIASLRRWVTDFAARHGAEADPLLAAAVKSLRNDRERITAGADVLAALAAVIRDTASFPNAHPELETLRALLTTEEAQRRFAGELRAWLEQYPPAWWTRAKNPAYADAKALVARIELENKKPDTKVMLDLIFQLILHHEPEYPVFAKYANWAVWYLNSRKLDDAMLARLSRAALDLPAGPSDEIVEAWLVRAAFLRRTRDFDGARALFSKIMDGDDARDFQKVEAGGELGLLELELNRPEAALAAWRRIEPDHVRHRHGIDYLYPALLLEVSRGELDRGTELLARIRAQDQKWLDEAYNARPLKHLLRAGTNPAALKTYWAHTIRWRSGWEQMLAAHDAAPAALPLRIDFADLEEKITAAISAKKRADYLASLDVLARTAQCVPLYAVDLARAVNRADAFGDEFQSKLYDAVAPLLTDLRPVDPEFDAQGRLWETIILTNNNRRPEAAPKARQLYLDRGPKDAIGMNALRIWAIAARKTPGEEEVLRIMHDLFANPAPVVDRLDSVRAYSDSLYLRNDTVQQIALLERETARPDFKRDGEIGKILLARLAEARTTGAAAVAFGDYVKKWSATPGHAWLRHVRPQSLDDSRIAGRDTPITSPEKGYTRPERTKFNLLFALDESRDTTKREEAFRDVVLEAAFSTNDYARFTDDILAVVSDEALSQDTRAYLLSVASWRLASDGRAEQLRRCMAHPLYPSFRDSFRQSVDALLGGLTLVEAGKHAEAFAAITALPLDDLRLTLATKILQALVLDDRAATAEALVAGADKLATDPALERSPAMVRLEWARALRRAQELAPFVTLLRQQVARLPAAQADCPPAVQNVCFIAASACLTQAERAALLGNRLRRLIGVVDDLDSLLSLIRDAQPFTSGDTEIGLVLFESVVALPLNDQAKSQLLTATFGVNDTDDPAVAPRLAAGLEKLCMPAAQLEQPQTAAKAQELRARVALRADHTERPAALFDPAQTKLIPATTLEQLRLRFHISRGQEKPLLAALDALDPSLIGEFDLLPYIDPVLHRLDRKLERSLCREAAKESLRRDIDSVWSDPHWAGAAASVYDVAAVDGFAEFVPDAWFEHLAAMTRHESARNKLAVARAYLRRDWPKTKAAVDELLRLEPTFYAYYLIRARAAQHLGQTETARADYDTFLKYCLDDAEYQSALHERQALDSADAD